MEVPNLTDAPPLKYSIKGILQFLGGRGVFWLIIGTMGSFGLVAADYGVAVFLQLLFAKIGLVGEDSVAIWIRDWTSTSLALLCLGFVFLGLLRAIALFLSGQSVVVFGQFFTARLRQLLCDHILLTESGQTLSSASVNNRISEIFPRTANFCANSVNFIIALIQMISLALALLWIAPREATLGLGCILVFGFVVMNMARKVRRNSALVPKQQEKIFDSLFKILKNRIFIRISQIQRLEHEKLSDQIHNYFVYSRNAQTLTNILGAFPVFVGMTLLAVLIYLSQSYFLTSGSVLMSFLYLFVRFVQQLSGVVKTYGSLSTEWAHFDSSYKYFFSLPEIDVRRETRRGELLDWAPDIDIQNLSFKWNDNESYVLRDLSFKVKAGEFCGIVGPSGVGKSTLLHLILGLLAPTGGSIRVGAMMPRDFLKRYAASIGYVGPEPFLVPGSIRDNLLYGLHEEVEEHEVWAALRVARMEAAVRVNSRGLDHPISEVGEGLSMGQKQRLALARALLRKPKLLILDELSANLDAATELEINESILKLVGKCTILAVSHRRALLSGASFVLDLESKTLGTSDRLTKPMELNIGG